MKKYYLKVNGKHVEVTKEVYKAYYKEYERERYLINLSIKHECSLDMLKECGYPIEMHISKENESVEDTLINNETWTEIMGCLQLLTPYERKLITDHYLNDVRQVILAKRSGKSKQAINQSINRIIRKIKKLDKL